MTYYNIQETCEKISFQQDLMKLISKKRLPSQPIIILCIGTDRATGDCLGPIVGTSLTRNSMDATIYGSLISPVHANNLEDTLSNIYLTFEHPFLIAIDACLGTAEHIGYITLQSGSLTPGESLQKQLPNIGDISITGIVNQTSHSNFLILQSTRLHQVMLLANTISVSLASALQMLQMYSTIPTNTQLSPFIKSNETLL